MRPSILYSIAIIALLAFFVINIDALDHIFKTRNTSSEMNINGIVYESYTTNSKHNLSSLSLNNLVDSLQYTTMSSNGDNSDSYTYPYINTISSTGQYPYLLHIKTSTNISQDVAIKEISDKISPYRVLHNISRDVYIITGPFNPIYPLLNTLAMNINIPSVSDNNILTTKLINMLTLTSDQLISLFPSSSIHTQLYKDKYTLVELQKMYINVINYLHIISSLDGIVALSHYTSDMKLTETFMSHIDQYITTITQSNDKIDLNKCLAEIYYDRIHNNISLGDLQIESDKHLDYININENISEYQHIFDLLSTDNNPIVPNIMFATHDKDGIPSGIDDYEYYECYQEYKRQNDILHSSTPQYTTFNFILSLFDSDSCSQNDILRDISTNKQCHDIITIEPRYNIDNNITDTSLLASFTSRQMTLDNTTQYIDDIKLCIDYITNHPYVSTISYLSPLNTLNNKAKYLLQDKTYRTTSMWERGLTGKDQVIIVGDTGVDYDHCMFYDYNRPTTGHIGKYHETQPDMGQRKIVWYITDYGDKADDSSGHGTHVAGTVAGSIQYPESKSDYNQVITSLQPYNGHAVNAKMVIIDMKRVTYNELNVPSDLYHTIFYPFTSVMPTAGISSHSWGGGTKYTEYSLNTDKFAYANPYHLAVFAAGNDGRKGYHTILSPGNCKNVLTVGASENLADSKGVGIVQQKIPSSSSSSFSSQQQQQQYSIVETIPSYTIPSVTSSYTPNPNISQQSSHDIVLSYPLDACTNYSSDDTSKYNGKIVLVMRGTCSFTVKSNRVYNAGASGIIIINNVDSPPIIMGTDGDAPAYTRTFFALMIARSDGLKLINYYTRQDSWFNTPGHDTPLADGTIPIFPNLSLYGPVTHTGGSQYTHNMASFSSRGPTTDGRVKPDIVAPGATIYSARSDGTTSNLPNCLAASSGGITVLSGTSMATPATSGSIALIKEYFETGIYNSYYTTLDSTLKKDGPLAPYKEKLRLSSAGLKAVVINSGQNGGGSVDTTIKGQAVKEQVSMGPRSIFQGWGLLNLDRVLMFSDQSPTYINNHPIASSLASPSSSVSASPASIQSIVPPSRLYVFDSLSEDTAAIQYILKNPTLISDANIYNKITRIISKYKGTNDDTFIYTHENIYSIINEMTTSIPQNSISIPYSYILDDSTMYNYNKCAPVSTSSIDTQDTHNLLTSCGLSSYSMHSHCFSLHSEDIIRLAEHHLSSGATPSSTVTTSHTLTHSYSHYNLDNVYNKDVPSSSPQKIPFVYITSKDWHSSQYPYVSNPSVVRSVLSWTDKPGTLQDSILLQHNLDIIQTISYNKMYYISSNSIGYITIDTTTNKTYLTNIQNIDWSIYKNIFPSLFSHTDNLLRSQAQIDTSSSSSWSFASPLLPTTRYVTYGNDSQQRDVLLKTDIANNSNNSYTTDTINNVEQTSYGLNNININIYTLLAAYIMNDMIDVTIGIYAHQLSSPTQHYAMSITGVIPAGLTIPQQEDDFAPIDINHGDSSTTITTMNTLSTLSEQKQQEKQQRPLSSTGVCTFADQGLFCPNNCNNHGQCINGRCICQSEYVDNPQYTKPIAIQYTGDDCSSSSTSLNTLCQQVIPSDGYNYLNSITSETCPTNDKLSTPLITPITSTISPWQWHYYSIPSNIIDYARLLSIYNGNSNQDADDQEQEDDNGDDDDNKDDDNDNKNNIIARDNVYIGIKFTTSLVPGNASYQKGDPDMFVSYSGIPTLSSYNQSNNNCDNCYSISSLYTQYDTTNTIQHDDNTTTPSHAAAATMMMSSQSFIDNSIGQEGEEQQQHKKNGKNTLSFLYHDNSVYSDISSYLSDVMANTPAEDQDEISSSSSSFATMSLSGSTHTKSSSSPFPLASNSLPESLRNDKNIIWIDAHDISSSSNGAITIGIYGYCCYNTVYSISTYAIRVNAKDNDHTNDNDSNTPSSYTLGPAVIILLIISLILVCICLLWILNRHSCCTQCTTMNKVDGTSNIDDESIDNAPRGFVSCITAILCCGRYIYKSSSRRKKHNGSDEYVSQIDYAEMELPSSSHMFDKEKNKHTTTTTSSKQQQQHVGPRMARSTHRPPQPSHAHSKHVELTDLSSPSDSKNIQQQQQPQTHHIHPSSEHDIVGDESMQTVYNISPFDDDEFTAEGLSKYIPNPLRAQPSHPNSPPLSPKEVPASPSVHKQQQQQHDSTHISHNHHGDDFPVNDPFSASSVPITEGDDDINFTTSSSNYNIFTSSLSAATASSPKHNQKNNNDFNDIL